MSREIKFRAWDKKNKILLPIELLDFSDWWVQCKKPKDAPKENGKAFYGERNSFKNEETDRHILMQYTGVKDKNGKEIYEGDIVKFTDCYDCSTENGYDFDEYCNIGQVVYDDEILAYNITNRNSVDREDIFEYVEVIGNIYENPELLEVKENE